jgi:hypothetical protein
MTNTADLLETAGRLAYRNGRPAAPALDATVIAAIGDRPVGTGAVEIMQAFARGYEGQRDAELALILAED